MCALYDAGDVAYGVALPAVHFHDSDLRMQCSEGIGGNLRARVGNGIEQRALARVGIAYQANVGHEAQLKKVMALVAGLLVAVLIGVLATRQSGPDQMRAHLVGQIAPPVVGTTIDAEVWDLDGQRGRWVVVNFFSTTCVPCIREHPELVAFAEDHVAADDVRVVSVAFDDSAAAIEKFFRERGGGWPVLATRTGYIAVDWGVVAVPES